jgi:hypothetical protein
MLTSLTPQLVAESSLLGMGFDVLGGCYLAYDLLGGKRGPLRTITRATGYVALFFIGYLLVLGLRYALVAATGMGIILVIEYRLAGLNTDGRQERRSFALVFGFLRGVVLGLAGMTIAGPAFGAAFGLLSGVGLSLVYLMGFTPTRDYQAESRPRTSRRKILASFWRASAVGAAGVIAGLLASSLPHRVAFGLKLGLAAGTVSALVGLFSPAIEWWIENLPERRLGMLGIGLIFIGMILQSVQYWVVVFGVPVR